MNHPATVPTDDQLSEYAEGLDDLYRDILAAFRYAELFRQPRQGVYESTIRNFLRNMASVKPGGGQWLLRSGPASRDVYLFSHKIDDYGDNQFSAAVDRLIEYGFLEPRNSNGLGLLVPTQVGERLIGILTKNREPVKDPPAIQKPNWR